MDNMPETRGEMPHRGKDPLFRLFVAICIEDIALDLRTQLCAVGLKSITDEPRITDFAAQNDRITVSATFRGTRFGAMLDRDEIGIVASPASARSILAARLAKVILGLMQGESDPETPPATGLDAAFAHTGLDQLAEKLRIMIGDVTGSPSLADPLRLTILQTVPHEDMIEVRGMYGDTPIGAAVTGIEIDRFGPKHTGFILTGRLGKVILGLIAASGARQTSPVASLAPSDTHQEPRAARQAMQEPPFTLIRADRLMQMPDEVEDDGFITIAPVLRDLSDPDVAAFLSTAPGHAVEIVERNDDTVTIIETIPPDSDRVQPIPEPEDPRLAAMLTEPVAALLDALRLLGGKGGHSGWNTGRVMAEIHSGIQYATGCTEAEVYQLGLLRLKQQEAR